MIQSIVSDDALVTVFNDSLPRPRSASRNAVCHVLKHVAATYPGTAECYFVPGMRSQSPLVC